MCVYCFIADWANRWIPDQPEPWSPWSIPGHSPSPAFPWTREQLDQFEDILRKVKEMEDKLGGCPCEEPGKMDFLKKIRERLDRQDEQITIDDTDSNG